jgi:predicted metalloprotease
MRLDDEQESSNIEDRRGQGGGGFGFPGGGGRRVRIGGRRGGMGIGTIILMLIAMFVFKINPLELLGGGGGVAPQTRQQTAPPSNAQQDELKRFVSRVLHTTETTWTKKFAEEGKQYRKPTLVLFSGYVRSACGMAQSAMGPFYCPGDQKVYLDMSFFNDMKSKMRAGGDFAYAYVIAHEIGHHIQTLLGISAAISNKRRQVSKVQGNALSVRMELQADCLAGVWGHDNKLKLDQGDIQEALNAANAIGDDRLQRQSTGRVVPESFTHGTSAQRMKWFQRGFRSGSIGSCDTF